MEVRGPQRRGQSGKAEVKGHSGQSPWWGRVWESSERVEQQGLWEERPREAWGPPQNGEAPGKVTADAAVQDTEDACVSDSAFAPVPPPICSVPTVCS